MSEFVLKLAPWSSVRTTWIPGVSKIKRMDTSTASKCLEEWADYEPDYEHANMDETSEIVVTLIWVEAPHYAGYLAVEQAWLVGPGGGTVDRIHTYG